MFLENRGSVRGLGGHGWVLKTFGGRRCGLMMLRIGVLVFSRRTPTYRSVERGKKFLVRRGWDMNLTR